MYSNYPWTTIDFDPVSESKLREAGQCLLFLLPVHVTCSPLWKEASDKHVFLLWLVWVSIENVNNGRHGFLNSFCFVLPEADIKGKQSEAERVGGDPHPLVWTCKSPRFGMSTWGSRLIPGFRVSLTSAFYESKARCPLGLWHYWIELPCYIHSIPLWRAHGDAESLHTPT